MGFFVFSALFFTTLGATLDQTVPEVNHAVGKYIVNAEHDGEQANGSTRNPK